MDDASLRSAIDGIALEIAERGGEAEELRTLIADKVLEYMASKREEHGSFGDEEIDRIISGIIRGVLKRLEEIAIGGGRIGSA